jgi:hypothetical protein
MMKLSVTQFGHQFELLFLKRCLGSAKLVTDILKLQIISSLDEISVSKIIQASHKSKELDNHASDMIKLGSNLLVGSILERPGVSSLIFSGDWYSFSLLSMVLCFGEIGDLF